MGGLINIKNNNNGTVQRMKFSIKYFFSKCDQNLQFSADLFTFTEEILNGKLHFYCTVNVLDGSYFNT